jgi:hypothetical protein
MKKRGDVGDSECSQHSESQREVCESPLKTGGIGNHTFKNSALKGGDGGWKQFQ